jgi:succinate dehydrogenase flavin-adding protein (antitoxin of CptAB toxin-antitoxin module)
MSLKKQLLILIISLLLVGGVATACVFLVKSDETKGDHDGEKDKDRKGDEKDQKKNKDIDHCDSFEELDLYLQQFIEKQKANLDYLAKKKEYEKQLSQQQEEIKESIKNNTFLFPLPSFNISNITETNETKKKEFQETFSKIKNKIIDFNNTYQKYSNETQKILVSNITTLNETLTNFSNIVFNFDFRHFKKRK